MHLFIFLIIESLSFIYVVNVSSFKDVWVASFIFKVTKNYIIIFLKSMNPVQKYPHIIELFTCILNMFVFMPNKCFDIFENIFNNEVSK